MMSKLIQKQILCLVVLGFGADADGVVILPDNAALLEVLIALPIKGEENHLL